VDNEELKSEIQKLLREICTTGDPWELSELGAEAHIRRMNGAYEQLTMCIDCVQSRMLRKQILKTVYHLAELISEIIEEHHNVKRAATKQAYVARAGRNRKVAERHKELIQFIEAEAKSLNLIFSKGIKFAQIIRPGVRRRLGLEPEGEGWPSASTIKGIMTKLRAR
jgi:hypothetical protein